MESTNYTSAAGFRDYVEDISGEIFTKLFLAFTSAALFTKHEGVKGVKVWTEMQLNSLARRYNSAFQVTDNIDLKPVELRVHANKIEHKEIPQDLEGTYLGFLRSMNFNKQDWPFERFSIMKLLEKFAGELEVAVWQGEAAAVPAIGDLMRNTFDGFLKLFADAITATTLTPVATGITTEANIYDSLMTMWNQVSPELKKGGTDIFMSVPQFDNYLTNLENKFAGSDVNYVEVGNQGYTAAKFRRGGGNTLIHAIPGMGDSNRIIMIPRAQLHYGYDGESDFSNFNFQQLIRELFYWMDFKLGVQVTLAVDGVCVINDAA